MIAASNTSSRSSAIADRPSSALRNANVTPPPKSRRVEPVRPCWISSATWRLSSTTSTRSSLAITRGSRDRMRSTSEASMSRAGPETNSIPAPGSPAALSPRIQRTVPSIAIGSSRPGKLSTSWTWVPTGSERLVVTKVPPDDRLSVKSPTRSSAPSYSTNNVTGSRGARRFSSPSCIICDCQGSLGACRIASEPPLARRDTERKGRTSPDPARHVDLAAVVLDDLLGERQAQPGAALLRGEERLEQPRQLLAGDPDAVVLDRDLDPAARAARAHDHAAAAVARHRIGGVAHQVDQALPDLVGVDVADRVLRVELGVEPDVAVREVLAHEADQVVDDRVERLPGELGLAAAQAEVDLGDLGQPIDLAADLAAQLARLAVALAELVFQELGVEADRRQRVADLVRDLAGHLAGDRDPRRAQLLLLALLHRPAHRVELAGEIGDLGRAGLGDPLAVVARGDPPGALAQPAQRPQRDRDPRRDHQAEHHGDDAKVDRAHQDRALVPGQPVLGQRGAALEVALDPGDLERDLLLLLAQCEQRVVRRLVVGVERVVGGLE